ncbi:MAG: cytochrome c3 family protein [Candidatus Glassbacteria bacterium]|nr:cytochrome c3 family protein [Candidatus Glassbacteria bacterium]
MAKSWRNILALLFLGPVLLLALGQAQSGRRARPELVFSHRLHVEEMGMECGLCHSRAEESRTGSDNLLPAMAACQECHDLESCGTCHSDTLNPRAVEQVTGYSPKFSHAAHLAKEVPCERCHAGVSVSDSAASEHLPAMEPCMACHDGIQAEKACILCHEHPRGKLPVDHVFPAWKTQHGDDARLDDAAACMLCHERNDCQQCHQGDNLFPRTHPLGFEFNHALEVRTARSECAACHEDRSFCLECHRMKQVYPRSHQLSSWAVPQAGGRHATRGKINIEECAACHGDDPEDSPVCAACHGI